LEETHVAPKLDIKLQSLGAGLSNSTKDDIFSSLLELSAAQLKQKAIVAVRDLTQAAKDAESDKSQIHIDIADEYEDE